MDENHNIFLAATGRSISRAEFVQGVWQVTQPVERIRVNCIIADPFEPQRLYAGTQKEGLLVSEDAGKSWGRKGLKGIPVKSLAVSPHQPNSIYAGCNPVSIYVSHDGGDSWEELPAMSQSRKWWWFSPADPPGLSPYVQALTISPVDPQVIMAGIEVGGVLRSEDGGHTWSKRHRGALLDCHSLMFHPKDGNWVYEGGAGGAAISKDGGKTWRKPKEGLDKRYGWMVAADPERPEVWYLSASSNPNPLRGQFVPIAHVDGQANAHIYRSVGGAPWDKLTDGGLPEPLDYMAYALVSDPIETGHLFAGLSNGDVWHTMDYGNSWEQLPFNLGGIHRTMIMI